MIATFDDLLQAAGSQSAPQKLLLIFLGAELPADATPEQRAGFHAGHGGALVPLMCVDKQPGELASFAALSTEADAMHSGWQLVLAGALAGQQGQWPSDQAVDEVFQRWLAQIQSGQMEQVLAQTLAFTRTGDAVQLQA